MKKWLLTQLLSTQYGRDFAYNFCGWKEQFKYLDKYKTDFEKEIKELTKQLDMADKAYADLESEYLKIKNQLEKALRPKRKYTRHKEKKQIEKKEA